MSMRHRWVIYGSSISAERVRWAPWRACGGAWVAVLRAAHPDMEILNRSGWGWISRDAVRAFGPRVLALRPTGVLLEFAINDADERRRCSVAESCANLEIMLRSLSSAHPLAGAIILLPPTPRGPYAVSRPRYTAYTAAWRHTAGAYGASVVDLDTAWQMRFSSDAAGEVVRRPDGLHLSNAVAEWVATLVHNAIEELVTRSPR